MTERQFPPPWSVDETEACFIVGDRNGFALSYVYYEEEPGRRSVADLLRRSRQ
jgi:hypothetical protein